MAQASERDRNRFEQNCADCGTLVPAGEGRLYRLRGAAANGRFRRVPRSRYTGMAYVVRCESCYERNDKITADAEAAFVGVPYQWSMADTACSATSN
jgi:hypothetical protein